MTYVAYILLRGAHLSSCEFLMKGFGLSGLLKGTKALVHVGI